MRVTLPVMYRRLLRVLGPQGWWPAESPFEMMVGAILTQGTSWHNVEQAISRLKRAKLLSSRALLAHPKAQLERVIQPAGFFREKARRLRVLARWLQVRSGGRMAPLFATPWPRLRRELLALHGIGPETADAILLYGGAAPVFVVDAYTRRILRRHRLIGPRAAYADIQALAMRSVRPSTTVYNEFHALLIVVGKRWCHRRNPKCTDCPLGDWPHTREVVDHGSR
jgi:endonuclease-3 related protein